MLEISKSWDDFFSRESLLRASTGCAIGCIALLATFAATSILWSAAHALWICMIAGASAFGIWWLSRFAYWRVGSGSRVGIAFEGVRVPAEEVRRCQSLFESLVNHGSDRPPIALRQVPIDQCNTDESRAAFRHRFKMSAIIVLTASPLSGDSVGEQVRFSFSADAGREVNKALWNSLNVPLAGIAASRTRPTARADVLNTWAEQLFDTLLVILATSAINKSDWHEAERFLRIVDTRLAALGRPARGMPRSILRHMLSVVSLKPLLIASSQTPEGKAEQQRWISKMQLVVDEFAQEFPIIKTNLARALFLTNDLHSARALCKDLSSNANNECRWMGILGLAALDLIGGQYLDSSLRYKTLIPEMQSHRFNLDDLIDFADYCRSQGYLNAVFIQCFYRALAHRAVDADLWAEYDTWLAADPKRRPLDLLLRPVANRAVPPRNPPARLDKRKFKTRKK
jgi:hypothetical protein